jgi:hypothetical protein
MRRLYLITGIGLVAMILLDLALGRDIPGFYAVYGLVSCILIIVVSKWIGKHAIQRDEGYYTDHVEDHPPRDSDPARGGRT